MMRLFIAINFNVHTRDGLLALRDELRIKSRRGNFNLPENLHLTLAFLGECDQKQLAAAKSAMDAVGFNPLEVTIECIGNFRGGLCLTKRADLRLLAELPGLFFHSS
jgi:2'-5' RNA ligase